MGILTAETGAQGRVVAMDELESVGLAVVAAFNARDLEAGLALAHPDIVVTPSRVHTGVEELHGHAGLRRWAEAMQGRATSFDVRVSGMREAERRAVDRGTGSRRLAMFGDICIGDEPLSSWAAVLIIQNGLVTHYRSYLSSAAMLEEIGVLREPPIS